MILILVKFDLLGIVIKTKTLTLFEVVYDTNICNVILVEFEKFII